MLTSLQGGIDDILKGREIGVGLRFGRWRFVVTCVEEDSREISCCLGFYSLCDGLLICSLNTCAIGYRHTLLSMLRPSFYTSEVKSRDVALVAAVLRLAPPC